MNRFRTKKRAKDDSSASEQSSMPSFRGFRRGKKSLEEEPKKEFDLSSALPSDDNFRTSLLMTNLSARFSMLREQDDPNTKIGKASDDSVLFPKRQSRLTDFGFSSGLRGLSDIAEVESIKAPHLRNEVDSFILDDADSMRGGNGSIMNRSKPIEGNVLFGGRQKIYKVPASTAKGNTMGAMSGRALYDDDVSMSAFQLWRQNERQQHSLEADVEREIGGDEAETGTELVRSTSPMFSGYNRRRETSSTTSSASAIARNSTAATSITSQPATSSSARDSRPTSTAASSAGSTPVLERSVTRTRRLYEQALTQDMHDQQTSALSRMDTLSRQRPLGSRTPDLTFAGPSPAGPGSHERFGERRQILTKGSAPNLRSFSPPATASSFSGTPELGASTNAPSPSVSENNKNAFGGLPPLSPPISEAGEQAQLSIQPNDHGKATAMGVFQKPLEPYDESRYAQRQLQLQQGRETPNQRSRPESDASFGATVRSESSSSMQRQPIISRMSGTSTRLEPAVEEDHSNDRETTFFDDSDDSASGISPGRGRFAGMPQVVLERPADADHPALRESALPTPLSLSDKFLEQPPTMTSTLTAPSSRQGSPPDSPTLPEPTAGLSGMVRQHLRSESNVSSVYGAEPQNTTLSNDRDGADTAAQASSGSDQVPVDSVDFETDEFANQLADARRRVRERLTSYAETDSSSREPSPLRHADSRKDVVGQPSPPMAGSALGLGILKPKSSRGSLVDRTRNISGPQSKARKMLGIGAATMTASTSPRRQSFDDKDGPSLAPMQEETAMEDRGRDMSARGSDADTDAERSSPEDKNDDAVHPGLKAFRQARRELQRRKELATSNKHQAPQASHPDSDAGSGLRSRSVSGSGSGPDRYDQPAQPRERPTPNRENRSRQGTMNRDQKPPPVFYQQRVPSDESTYGRALGSQPASRQASTERFRSGSEASGGPGQSYNRPPPLRLRNNSSPYDESKQLAPLNPPRTNMLRSPGLPGTDIRRSPIMPPQGYPGSTLATPSPHYLDRSRSALNLATQHGRGGYDSHSGQPSPVSPMSTDPMAGSMGGRSRSDPATATLQNTTAPPLPPLNPLRRREGSGSNKGGAGPSSLYPGHDAYTQASASTSRLPLSGSDMSHDGGRSPFPMSDAEADGQQTDRRRMRRPTGNGESSPRSPGFRSAPAPWQRGPASSPNQFITAAPPASRTVLTPGAKPTNNVVPSGMF